MGLPVLQRHHPQQARRADKPVTRTDDVLSSFIDSWTSLPRLLDGSFTPLADVEEADDSYVVSVDLPGVKKDDVEVTVSGRRVSITGRRKDTERIGILRRRTRSVGEFAYDVLLPGDVDDDKVNATMDAGVLTVLVPKAASERRRRIHVS